jgi:hypothetical protein
VPQITHGPRTGTRADCRPQSRTRRQQLGTLVRQQASQADRRSRHEANFDRRRDGDGSRHQAIAPATAAPVLSNTAAVKSAADNSVVDVRWGWGGWLAAGVIGGIALGALTSPYYSYGYGVPAYSYPYGYAGYYGYTPYTYGYAPYYGYSGYTTYAYAPRYYRARRYYRYHR